ncbi:hypothetical protein GWI33_020447 [Rhynchophorus ferrugineus]|uniref:Uncharacterized protein n=1 Tax=Rhynchophorus ferrugineus TaxID=354439 RepID=A0A834HRH9_RHYFE|nr:hypothetical protein GWI33_020447 [Rhynchophorus ferrugineus]
MLGLSTPLRTVRNSQNNPSSNKRRRIRPRPPVTDRFKSGKIATTMREGLGEGACHSSHLQFDVYYADHPFILALLPASIGYAAVRPIRNGTGHVETAVTVNWRVRAAKGRVRGGGI